MTPCYTNSTILSFWLRHGRAGNLREDICFSLVVTLRVLSIGLVDWRNCKKKSMGEAKIDNGCDL
jgi:hypothetical protein